MTEETIFGAALEKRDPTERAAYLEQACAGNSELYRRVAALIRSHEQSGGFLNEPALEQRPAVHQTVALAGSRIPPEPPSMTATQSDPPASDALQNELLALLEKPRQEGLIGHLGHYQIRSVVGRGGMGVVLEAFDTKLHRVVAIKLLHPQMAASGQARQRFVREARAAAAVTHDNVIAIHAVEDAGPVPYLVMQFVSGISLDARIAQNGALELKEILRLGKQIAAGLAAAHAQGLIHRDVKPGNILLENGVQRVKLTDFGLARAVDDASLTQSGVIVGTPLYMAPEQARGEALDHRADLFSLGSVLYTLCTGRPAFRASNSMAVMKRVCEAVPRAIREVNPDIPEWLCAIIDRLLTKDPELRFASAAEVEELLGRHLAEVQQFGAARLDGLRRQPSPFSALGAKKSPLRWGWTLAAVLSLGVVGLVVAEASGATNLRGLVIRLWSPDGTLVVEVDDPGVSVTVEGTDLIITGAGPKEIRLKPGQYQIDAQKDGKLFWRELVTVERDGRRVVRISKESAAAPAVVVKPAAVSVPTAAELANRPSPLDGLKRGAIPADVLARSGGGDAAKAPPELVAVLAGEQGHKGHVLELAVSPDGKLLASVGRDNVLKLWDLTNGQFICDLGPVLETRGLAFSPDRRTLAAAATNDTLNLWDVETKKVRHTLRGLTAANQAVAFNPDGSLVATGGDDQTVRLWETSSGRLLRNWAGLTTRVFGLAFSPDGKTLASGMHAGWVGLWDVASGDSLGLLSGGQVVRGVAFSPDGKTLAVTAETGLVALWDPAVRRRVRTLTEFRPGRFYPLYPAWRADGGLLVWCEPWSDVVWLCDLSHDSPRLEQRRVFPPTGDWVHGLALAPDGRHLITGNPDGTIFVLRLAERGKVFKVGSDARN